jgi:hypothetical protein
MPLDLRSFAEELLKERGLNLMLSWPYRWGADDAPRVVGPYLANRCRLQTVSSSFWVPIGISMDRRALARMRTTCRPRRSEIPRVCTPHQLPTRWRGYHFFRSASRVTSFSSMDSASRFLRRAFSASSAFRRFASETSIPPSLLRHR